MDPSCNFVFANTSLAASKSFVASTISTASPPQQIFACLRRLLVEFVLPLSKNRWTSRPLGVGINVVTAVACFKDVLRIDRWIDYRVSFFILNFFDWWGLPTRCPCRCCSWRHYFFLNFFQKSGSKCLSIPWGIVGTHIFSLDSFSCWISALVLLTGRLIGVLLVSIGTLHLQDPGSSVGLGLGLQAMQNGYRSCTVCVVYTLIFFLFVCIHWLFSTVQLGVFGINAVYFHNPWPVMWVWVCWGLLYHQPVPVPWANPRPYPWGLLYLWYSLRGTQPSFKPHIWGISVHTYIQPMMVPSQSPSLNPTPTETGGAVDMEWAEVERSWMRSTSPKKSWCHLYRFVLLGYGLEK